MVCGIAEDGGERNEKLQIGYCSGYYDGGDDGDRRPRYGKRRLWVDLGHMERLGARL
jgi:hypothetical protein